MSPVMEVMETRSPRPAPWYARATSTRKVCGVCVSRLSVWIWSCLFLRPDSMQISTSRAGQARRKLNTRRSESPEFPPGLNM